jgi:hypothetical protein
MDAFKEIGIDQFYIKLEEETNCINKDMVNERVHYYTCLYDSMKNGYNYNRIYNKKPIDMEKLRDETKSIRAELHELGEAIQEAGEAIQSVLEPIPEVEEPVPEVIEPVPEVIEPDIQPLGGAMGNEVPLPEVEEPIIRRSGRTFDNPLYRYYLVKSILTELYGEEKADKIKIDKFDVDTIHALLNKALKQGISINF